MKKFNLSTQQAHDSVKFGEGRKKYLVDDMTLSQIADILGSRPGVNCVTDGKKEINLKPTQVQNIIQTRPVLATRITEKPKHL